MIGVYDDSYVYYFKMADDHPEGDTKSLRVEKTRESIA